MNLLLRVLAQTFLAENRSDAIKNLLFWLVDKDSKSKRPELLKFFKGIDWDKLLLSVANRDFKQFGLNVDENFLIDYSLKVVSDLLYGNALDSFDTEKGEMKGFFTKIFEYALLSKLRKDAKYLQNEVSIDDIDWVDENLEITQEDVESAVILRRMIEDLDNFLMKKYKNEAINKTFSMLIEGYKALEIAKDLGVSESLVSRYVKYIKEAVKEYAKSTGNELLAKLIENVGTKKHYKHAAMDPFSELVEVFNLYKKYKGSNQGEGKEDIYKLQILRFPDFDDEDNLVSSRLSRNISNTDLDKRLSEFYKCLSESDDVVETDSGDLGVINLVE